MLLVKKGDDNKASRPYQIRWHHHREHADSNPCHRRNGERTSETKQNKAMSTQKKKHALALSRSLSSLAYLPMIARPMISMATLTARTKPNQTKPNRNCLSNTHTYIHTPLRFLSLSLPLPLPPPPPTCRGHDHRPDEKEDGVDCDCDSATIRKHHRGAEINCRAAQGQRLRSFPTSHPLVTHLLL